MNKDEIEHLGKFLENVPVDIKKSIDQQTFEKHYKEFKEFLDAFNQGNCYSCHERLEYIDKDNPCIHWLLRQGRFKKKDFPLITNKYGYFQISMYLRWVANSNPDKFQMNINDMKDEQSEKKVFQSTIKWENIEWSFECSENDFKGHDAYINYPHYHFQMYIDGRPFINYNGFHNKFTKQDLFYLYSHLEHGMELSYGAYGAGMQDAMETSPKDILATTRVKDGDEENGAFRFTTIVQNQEGIDGDLIQDTIDESRRDGKSLSLLLQEKLDDKTKVSTFIQPSDKVPEIAKRTEHKKR